MFLSLDGTFWVQLVNFAIFYAILRVVFLTPVGEALRKRREYIEGVQGDYDRNSRQVATLRGEAERKRGAARREAEEAVARARAQAEGEAEAVLAERNAQAQTIAEDARRTIQDEVAAVRGREPELARGLARTLLERAVGAPR